MLVRWNPAQITSTGWSPGSSSTPKRCPAVPACGSMACPATVNFAPRTLVSTTNRRLPTGDGSDLRVSRTGIATGGWTIAVGDEEGVATGSSTLVMWDRADTRNDVTTIVATTASTLFTIAAMFRERTRFGFRERRIGNTASGSAVARTSSSFNQSSSVVVGRAAWMARTDLFVAGLGVLDESS